MGIKEDLVAEGYTKTPYGYVKGVKSENGDGVDLHTAQVDRETMERAPDEVEYLDLAQLQQQKVNIQKRLQQVNGKIDLYNATMAAP